MKIHPKTNRIACDLNETRLLTVFATPVPRSHWFIVAPQSLAGIPGFTFEVGQRLVPVATVMPGETGFQKRLVDIDVTSPYNCQSPTILVLTDLLDFDGFTHAIRGGILPGRIPKRLTDFRAVDSLQPDPDLFVFGILHGDGIPVGYPDNLGIEGFGIQKKSHEYD